jgi:hypothetical protein
MRVFIQNCDSLKFYCGQGRWCDSAMNAKDFSGSIRALDYIRKHHIPRAQIVLKFGSDEFDVVLPSHDCMHSRN